MNHDNIQNGMATGFFPPDSLSKRIEHTLNYPFSFQYLLGYHFYEHDILC